MISANNFIWLNKLELNQLLNRSLNLVIQSDNTDNKSKNIAKRELNKLKQINEDYDYSYIINKINKNPSNKYNLEYIFNYNEKDQENKRELEKLLHLFIDNNESILNYSSNETNNKEVIKGLYYNIFFSYFSLLKKEILKPQTIYNSSSYNYKYFKEIISKYQLQKDVNIEDLNLTRKTLNKDNDIDKKENSLNDIYVDVKHFLDDFIDNRKRNKLPYNTIDYDKFYQNNIINKINEELKDSVLTNEYKAPIVIDLLLVSEKRRMSLIAELEGIEKEDSN